MLYSLKECRNKLLAYVNKRMITYVPHTNIIGEQVYSNEKKMVLDIVVSSQRSAHRNEAKQKPFAGKKKLKTYMALKNKHYDKKLNKT